MDKNIGKISELVSESWIRRALNSSEVFQQILRIYDSEHQEKLIITILKSLDTTLVQNQSTIYVKGEPAKYAYFIKRGYVSMQTVLGDNIR